MDSAVNIGQFVKQLHSPDAAKRKQAIVALGRSKDPAALRPLADAYRNETDEELRELALKAGRFIRQQAEVVAAAATPVAPPAEPAPKPVTLDPKLVPQKIQQAAREYADEALSLASAGNYKKAIKQLHKAIQINPAITQDSYFINIAGIVMKRPEEEAIAALEDAAQAGKVVASAEKDKETKGLIEHVKEVRTVTWGMVTLDLILYALITIGGPILLVLILGQSFENWRAAVTAAANAPATGAIKTVTPPDQNWLDISDTLRVLDVTMLIAMGGTSLLSGMASIFIQTLAIHLTATRLFKGTGTLDYLLYKLVSFYNRFLITVLLILVIGIWVGIGNDMPALLYIACALLVPYALVSLMKVAGRIAEAYRFRTGTGCITLVIASVLLFVLNGVIYWAAYASFSASVRAMLPGR
jgi:hypothetical protein